MGMKIKSKWKFLPYTVMYARVPYITKIKFKRKFEIWNTKLSKISLPTVFKKTKLGYWQNPAHTTTTLHVQN